MTSQAKRLVDAVRGLGVERRDFRVSTDSQIIRGVRHYGDASLMLLSRTARQTVVENADVLRGKGFKVKVLEHEGKQYPMVWG
jgi:hypothetical protein